MAPLTPEQCLAKLKIIYRDAMKAAPISDQTVIEWAKQPELWATQQIQYRGWSFPAAEAVVRQCRVLRKRAALAVATLPTDGPEAA